VASTLGANAQVSLEVTDADTAAAVGSGDVDVLSTPRVITLCEQATVEAIRPLLGEGQTSVGFRIEITHLVPVLVGRTVVASAALERIDGKRFVFNVTVNDPCGLVAAGKVTRVVVDSRDFMEKAR
jgi:fluoroacetyl-CoA thioesterase